MIESSKTQKRLIYNYNHQTEKYKVGEKLLRISVQHIY